LYTFRLLCTSNITMKCSHDHRLYCHQVYWPRRNRDRLVNGPSNRFRVKATITQQLNQFVWRTSNSTSFDDDSISLWNRFIILFFIFSHLKRLNGITCVFFRNACPEPPGDGRPSPCVRITVVSKTLDVQFTLRNGVLGFSDGVFHLNVSRNNQVRTSQTLTTIVRTFRTSNPQALLQLYVTVNFFRGASLPGSCLHSLCYIIFIQCSSIQTSFRTLYRVVIDD